MPGAPRVIAGWSESELTRWLGDHGFKGLDGLVTRQDLENFVLDRLPAPQANVLQGVDGTDTVTFPGGQPYASRLVQHGLTVAPRRVFVDPLTTGAGLIGSVLAGSVNETDFTAVIRTGDGANPAVSDTRDFYWLALA